MGYFQNRFRYVTPDSPNLALAQNIVYTLLWVVGASSASDRRSILSFSIFQPR
jgi:hypothetical protein